MSETLYWLSQVLADVPESDDWLRDAEKIIHSGLRFPKRRNDWRLGRWTVKRAVRAYLVDRPALSSVEIRAAENGAPEAFINNVPAKASISISHSEGRSFCTVGNPDLSIGCDLEHIEPREDNLVSDYFTPEEISFCHEAKNLEKVVAVNLIWSAKESILKILREGLRRDTRSVIVCPDPVASESSWNAWTGYCLESSRIFAGWWRTCDGFVYTLASDRPTSTPEQITP